MLGVWELGCGEKCISDFAPSLECPRRKVFIDLQDDCLMFFKKNVLGFYNRITSNQSPEVDFIYGHFTDETREGRATRSGTHPSRRIFPGRRCPCGVCFLLLAAVRDLLKGLAVHECWPPARALDEIRSNSGSGRFDFY